MISACCLLMAASVTIAFPREGQVLPPVSRAYAIGAVSPDVTNLVVAGQTVFPYRTGAWTSIFSVYDGTNLLRAVAFTKNHVVTNEVRLVVTPRERKYEKLPYAKDCPATALARVQKPEDTLIYLDPGHGGNSDTGAVSPHGRFEKTANLSLAQATANRLRAYGYRVKLTREDDRALDLYERARAAHKEKAAAFVSFHHNAPAFDADPAQRYSSVYVWNDLGEPLARAIAHHLGKSHEGLFPSKGVLRANFAVTRSPEIPSCLIEADFITSPMGEEDIFNPEIEAARAQAIADGIDVWCRKLNSGN